MVERILVGDRHDVIGVVRDPGQAADVEAIGASAVVLDLEKTKAATLAEHLNGVDAVIFAAGAARGTPAGARAGAGSNWARSGSKPKSKSKSKSRRKYTVDGNGAILLADAAELAGVRRVIVLSSLDADRFDSHSRDPSQLRLRAKSEADAAIRCRDWLDWTIVRPGTLTDEPPTGMVTVGDSVPAGSVPRADVAALVAALVTGRKAIRRQVEVVARNAPVARLELANFTIADFTHERVLAPA